MNKLHVKTGDTVILRTGKYGDKFTDNHDKHERKKAKVLEVSPKEGKAIVEGINLVTKHVKPTRQGQAGGIVKAEAAIYACKLQVVCPKCDKPTRTGIIVNTDGSKSRTCKKCGAAF